MGLILWFAPVFTVLLFILIKETKLLHIINIACCSILIVVGGFATKSVIANGSLSYKAFNNLFYLDSLSVIVLDMVIIISFLVSIYSIGYLKNEMSSGEINPKKIKIYYILMYTFVFTMILSISANNMGILWISIEGTTLASTFLVGFSNTKHSLEAAWKYVIICSVGIAVALVGIIFLHLSSAGVIDKSQALSWTVLFQNAEALNSSILRFSFIFIVIGFGTKSGLAPMHTWLPDAHSQAPSPISALLSGVLLNSALYAIIRTLSIVNKNLGDSDFTGRIMIGFGLLSIATSAIFILTQKDYKRLLAYSSIEHMGIIALSMGVFTPISVFAGLFHMINHSFTKSMLFLASGNILQKYETRDISKVRELLKTLPMSGFAFLIGLLAITGTPPFSVFASEINVFLSIFDAKHQLLGAILILLLAIIFVGIAVSLFKVFFTENDYEKRPIGETNRPGAFVLIVLLILITISGVYIPAGISNLLNTAALIITGGAN